MLAFALILATCVLALPAYAGAWLMPEGKGQLIVTTTFADAKRAYDARGRLIETPSYRKFETRAYLEHGLTEWLTLVAEGGYMSFRGAASRDAHLNLLIEEAKAGAPLSLKPPAGPRYEGLGLGAFGGRVRLFTYGPYIFSLEASGRFSSPEARRFLDMRDPVQADVRVQCGRPFEVFGWPGFVDAQIGYRSRGQNGDEIRTDLTGGLRPLPYVLLLAQSFSALSPWGGANNVVAAQKFQLSGVFDATPWLSLQLGAVAALSGVNSPAERGVITAVWLRY